MRSRDTGSHLQARALVAGAQQQGRLRPKGYLD